MPPDRLQSIVPMFGGGTRYVETLDAILEFVETHQPTTDTLVGWHRGTFANVSSRDSIMRRVRYL
jgi:putative restriction endonuclease